MTLQDIKSQIEQNKITSTFIIFNCDKNFIARQYIKEISKLLNLPITYIEDINSLSNKSKDIFFGEINEIPTLRIFNIDEFDYSTNELSNEKNLIIVTKKINKNTTEIYSDYIIDVPSIEHWCIKDYLYSILTGVNTKYIDWLMDNCNYDIDRLQLEAEKLLIFNENERNIVFEQMLEDNAFIDITNKTIFDFTDSIVKKDINKLKRIYEDIDNIDIEDIGLITVLYQNFKKLLQVWGNKCPTPENTGLSSKQIYAIGKLPRVWSEIQLANNLEFITSLDFKIKTGVMPMNIIRDYIVLKVLSR